MNETATVRIFLAKGSPTSIRTAEISNWTGKAVAGPRSQLEEILKRDEASKPGVYFLAGVNPVSGRDRVYIGEAEIIRNRLKSKDHLDRDFWKTLVFFVSKDENITKAHIKYLEGRLIEAARDVGRFEVDNSQGSGSHLPESDSADMDIFFARMEQLLPILGQEFLKPITKIDSRSDKEDLLYCEIKGLKAFGRQTENGFVILKGSAAVIEERPSTQKFRYAANLRKNLIEEGILVPETNHMSFVKDHEFSSPSAAAAVIHGGQANGLTAWRDEDGTTMKDKEEREVDSQ